MANSFYNHGSIPVYKSPGNSSDIRAEFDSVTAGFNKLPLLGAGVANYLISVDQSGTSIITIPNTYFLGTTNVLLSRASGAQALTGITSIDGQAATVVTNANLTGEVTSVGNAATLTNAAVIGKVLTGYVSGAGTLGAGDSILAAIQKLNGNIAAGAVNLTGPITSVGAVTSIASQTGTGTTFVMNTSPTLVTPNIGVALGSSLGLGGVTVARSPLHMACGSNSFALMQSTAGTGGTVLTNSDTIPIISNNGFAGYGGLATLPNRWGNATTIDAHTVVYIGGAQRNSGFVSSSLVFANWGYFTSTGVAAGGLGNATDQADAVKFKFEHTDGGGAFAQTLQLIAKSASLTQVVAMSVNNSGTVSLGGAVNAESLRVSPVASAVNYLQAFGAATGTPVTFAGTGADANVGINYATKGLGAHIFYYNSSSPSFQISPATNGVNYNVFSPSATGAPLIWQAAGTDATISMTVQPKGTGVLKVDCGANNGATQFQVACTGTTGANLLLSGNGATTPNKTIRAQAGNLEFINHAYTAVIMSLADSGQISLGGSVGNESVRVLNVAAAVNYLAISGAVTGGGTIIQASGTDANVSMSILPKGIGSVFVDGGANSGAAVLVVNNTGANGSRIKIVGNGATTPSKTLVVQSGQLTVLADAGVTLLTLTDAGALSVGSNISNTSGNITSAGTIKTNVYIVSSLPASPPNGTIATVSDGASFGARLTATGGGTVTALVMFTGGGWVYV